MTRLTLALAGILVTRRYRRQYTGKRRTNRTAPANHRLSPAAYQLVTRTPHHVPADPDENTGLLNPALIRPSGEFTTVNSGGAR